MQQVVTTAIPRAFHLAPLHSTAESTVNKLPRRDILDINPLQETGKE
jgi:hypothetical protein